MIMCVFLLLIVLWTSSRLFFMRLHKAVPSHGGHGTGSRGRRAGNS